MSSTIKSQYKPNNTNAERDNHIRFDRAPKKIMIAKAISTNTVKGAAKYAPPSGPAIDTNNSSETVKGCSIGVRHSCQPRNAIPARIEMTKAEVPAMIVRRT